MEEKRCEWTLVLEIREFKPEDLDAVARINKICLPENYSPSFFMDHYFENPRIFIVAVVDNEIIGYGMCRIEFGVSNLRTAFARKGHVISIAVMQTHRGKRIGLALMEASLQRVKIEGASEIYLEVRVSNNIAVELYKKLDFAVSQVSEGYYRDGESAYVMVKDLTK
jgi:ribosomal-protein-alanine N-acetyltransferase